MTSFRTMLAALVFFGASQNACAAYCAQFTNESLSVACQAGCLFAQQQTPAWGPIRPVHPIMPLTVSQDSNRRKKFEVQSECRDYCDSIEEQVGHAIAPCKASCAFYDEAKGQSSCGCDSTSSDYDRSCRSGCQYMDHVWRWEGGWD